MIIGGASPGQPLVPTYPCQGTQRSRSRRSQAGAGDSKAVGSGVWARRASTPKLGQVPTHDEQEAATRPGHLVSEKEKMEDQLGDPERQSSRLSAPRLTHGIEGHARKLARGSSGGSRNWATKAAPFGELGQQPGQMLREQGRHCPPSACLVGQGCSGRRSRFGECPPCRRHSIHVISAVSLNKPTLWALLPSSQT